MRRLLHNLYYFLLALFLLACSPLFAVLLFDYIVLNNNTFPPFILLVIVAALNSLLFSFLSISLWSSIKSNLRGSRKLLIIVASYIMLWFAFGNLYYFLTDIENYLYLQPLTVAAVDLYIPAPNAQIIQNMPFLWSCNVSADTLLPANRYAGYIDALYFSGTTMLTIGYGDFIPITPLIKMLSIFQAFLGQFINVVAVGIWLNNIKK